MYDLVEWAAAQPWSNGKIGISCFAMAQLQAAVEQPPHLEAIFPVAVTSDLFEATKSQRTAERQLRHAVPGHGGADLGPRRRGVAQHAQ